MTVKVRWVLLSALAATAAGCHSISPQREQVSETRTRSAALTLEAQGDAESLAAAALLYFPDGHQADAAATNRHRLNLLNRAVALDPTRAEFVWLQLHACGTVPQCNPEPMERRLRQLDPGNGIAWFGAVTRAYRSGDASALDATLESLARTGRMDIYWNRVVAELASKATGAGALSPSSSVAAIIGSLAAEAIPAYSALSDACKGAELARPGRTEVCRSIAGSLQNSDTLITQMMGVAIAKRVWEENSPQWLAAQEARRLYEYRSKMGTRVEFRQDSSDDDARRYLELCRTYRSEQDVLLAQLERAGINPTPP
ncbi:MAG: hypothetical protein QM718_02370 [Steroidobacteraceae bacterium]